MLDREMVFSYGVVLFECFATFFRTFNDLVPMYTCAYSGTCNLKLWDGSPIRMQVSGSIFNERIDLYLTDQVTICSYCQPT